MVASGKAYATLIEAHKASWMQEKIQEKNLRINKFISHPNPYILFFYIDEENEQRIKRLVQCLESISKTYLMMIMGDFFPTIRYTSMEVVDTAQLFTKEPYIGSILIVTIIILSVAAVLTDVLSHWYKKRHHNRGKYLELQK